MITQTKTKNTKSKVHIPAKALTPKGKKKKAEFEKQGWTFREVSDGFWTAELNRDGVNKKLEFPSPIDTLFIYIENTEISLKENSGEQKESDPEIHREKLEELKSNSQAANGAKRQPQTAKNENTTALAAIEIPVEQISPSSFEPQEMRRVRFRDEELEELAHSVKKEGLINPITVRPKAQGFEIVCGERRWLAAGKAGLSTITAFVKELSDDAAFDIQLQENLNRKQPHPMDEAASYDYLIEKKGATVSELVERFGKSEKYISGRLRLNSLIAAAQLALQQDEITLSHALEIAKYPAEAQREIYPLCFNNFGLTSQSVLSLRKFVEKIEEHYLLRLSKAPFSTSSTELHKEGRACVTCPERTSASPLLFEENYSKHDNCLNRACWNRKLETHIQIQRARVVETKLGITEEKEIKKSINKAPLVSAEYIWNNSEKPKEGFIGHNDYRELKRDDECPSAETGVFFNGNRIGQKVHLCRDPKCKVHTGYVSTSSSKDPEQESEHRLKRREELFDVRVRSRVRVRVLKQAADKFAGLSSAEPELIKPIAQRLWFLQNSRETLVTEALAPVVADYFNIEKGDRSLLYSVNNAVENRIEDLSIENARKIIFLMLHGNKNQMFFFEERGYNSDSYVSQKEIQTLAAEFDVDYQLLDAEERLSLAPMKQKDLFRDYLQKLESGDRTAKIPRMFTTKWTPKD